MPPGRPVRRSDRPGEELCLDGSEQRRETVSTRPPTRDRRPSLLVGNPVAETLLAMVVVSLAAWGASLVGLVGLFALAPPVALPPWTLVTSVYAHSGPGHLLSNAAVVLLAGTLVSATTTRLRFHAFFVATGALAGVAHVWTSGLLGVPTGVLGSSGAAFALVGYALAANPASTAVVDALRLPARAVVAVAALVGLVLTVLFSAPGSALVAHFAGAVMGFLAGRLRLLRVRR